MGALDNIRRFLTAGDYKEAAATSLEPQNKFSPGVPIAPNDGFSRTPRTHDFLTGTNISARPRRNERVSFQTLQGLVEAYDIAQMAITHRIDSIRSLDWYLEPMPGYDGDSAEAIAKATRLLKRPDGELPFRAWLSKFLWDVLAYDAGTLYRMRNNAGHAIGLRVVDGTTIAPMIDYHGNRPTGDAPAFVQFAQGVPWNWLTEDDIIYVPFRPMPNSPYGKSPLESVLLNANTDLRFQNYFLARFTEGTVPEGFATAPTDWGPDQISDFQDGWEAMMYGDDSKKHQIRWVPGGTTFTWSQENPFNADFSLFLMRKTAAAYHVTPNDLGFTDTVNLANGETQTEVQFRIGSLPMVQHVQDILTSFIQDDLGLPLTFQFNVGGEKDDRLATAQIAKIMIDAGVLSVSEVREEVYGLQEPDGQVVPRYIFTNAAGPIPIVSLLNIAGPTDAESGLPMAGPNGAEFVPAEGVAKVPKPINDVTKDVPVGAPGITSTTGVVGSPLIDDDDEDETSPTDEMVKSELAAFKRFVKARKRDGKWRDFNFQYATDMNASLMNMAGQSQMMPSDTNTTACIVLRAADTGRVLMIQRRLDQLDENAGKLDFPGGHTQIGETVLDAATREFCEEVGMPVPDGRLSYGWKFGEEPETFTAFIVDVETETLIVPRQNRDPNILDPDDPNDFGGLKVDPVLWVSPKDLKKNPMLKPVLANNFDIVFAAIVGGAFSHS